MYVGGGGGFRVAVGLDDCSPPNHKRTNLILPTRSTKRESWERERTDAAQSGTDVNLTILFLN